MRERPIPIISYREAEPVDYPVIAHMHSEVMAIHARHAPKIFKEPSDKAFGAPEITEYLKKGGFIFVAIADNKVVGYLSGRMVEKPEDSRKRRLDLVYLDAIYVRKLYRGKTIGIGKELVGLARKLAASNGEYILALDVWTFNREALKFCRELDMAIENLVMYDIAAI